MKSYEAIAADGQSYECEGRYISEALVNLSRRHPELIGQTVQIGGCRGVVTPSACDSI